MDFRIGIEPVGYDGGYKTYQSRITISENRDGVAHTFVSLIVDSTSMVAEGEDVHSGRLSMGLEDLQHLHRAIGYVLDNS